MTRSDSGRSGAVSTKIEREIKLTIDPDFRLPPLPGKPIPRHLLTSTYYDTDQYDLAHAGITLRHRAERGKQAWQLKLPLMNNRQEIEIVERRLDPPPAFCDLLFVHLGSRPLLPVATLRVWRTGVCVHMDHVPVADVTLDLVSVLRNGAPLERFRELEIEQLDGKKRTLPNLERRLRRAGAEDHDGRSKLFRAISLPSPHHKQPPAQDAPMADHMKWAIARYLRCLLAHDPGTRLGNESESLHQMRVATRKLRAVLRTAKPLLVPEWADPLEEELRWLSQVLGPTRDLDVQLSYFREEFSAMNVRDRQPLVHFIADLEVHRTKAREILLRDMRSTPYINLIRRLQEAKYDQIGIESAITLSDLAKSAFKKLRKAIRRLGPSPTNAEFHEVRKKTKWARYAAELAEPTVGKAASRFIKSACTVQSVLVMHQDAIQAETHVRAFLKHSTTVRAAFIAGRMVERQRERRERAKKNIHTLWKGLLKRGERAWE